MKERTRSYFASLDLFFAQQLLSQVLTPLLTQLDPSGQTGQHHIRPELQSQKTNITNKKMSPIALGSKHQDLLKAYLEVSKSEKPDWTSVALKADFATAKYARDQFAIVKKKLLTTPNGEPISLSDTHLTLLQTVIGALKADVGVAFAFTWYNPCYFPVANDDFLQTDWEKVAQLAEFKTPKYARDQWAIVRNKLSGASATSAAATPTSNRGTPSRKRKKREGEKFCIGESQEATMLTHTQTPMAAKKEKRVSLATKTRHQRRRQKR